MREIRVTGAFYPLIGKTFILPVHWIVVDNPGTAIGFSLEGGTGGTVSFGRKRNGAPQVTLLT